MKKLRINQSIAIEQAIIAGLLQRDQKAFSVLYGNYSTYLYRSLHRLVWDQETTADLLQETFIRIYKNIDRYDAEKGRLSTWMMAVAKGVAVDYLRRNPHHLKTQSLTYERDVLYTYQPKSEHIGVLDLLKALCPERKLAIEMVYFQHFTMEEAAKRLALPLGTLKTRVRQGLIDLRALLSNDIAVVIALG